MSITAPFPIKNEHHYLAEAMKKRNGYLTVHETQAHRAAKIARMRGMMKAYKDCGCMGSYDQVKARLGVYLKNINKKLNSGKSTALPSW